MGEEREVTQEQVQSVFPKVADTIADALACEARDLELNSRLIEDLGAESIDFLDIVFRLEQIFKVQIPRGKIIDKARGDLSEAEFERNGSLTDAGVVRLKDYLSEVPEDRFRPGLKVVEIPLLFTVETFCKLVVRALRTY